MIYIGCFILGLILVILIGGNIMIYIGSFCACLLLVSFFWNDKLDRLCDKVGEIIDGIAEKFNN